ncbi:tRNA (guanosine(46)-N7)-methyltransferase TrmB [Calidifontibacillus erzurumensis]|uniref:tRNA (guanine-N(7)-)-methyltransferase n=1 Tax=Calidifontibacillus erzurumensis TaxID=2741433 RepID=A0A8J8GF72_9BACI|nr:tRNA (guanosine(46)-N7)-methyltransferase TrmB [Calidifontibacillus erzurumensis]NSL51333.1 tRNA (guanosine(46)-N7)-methyltransferase TrmB [Calidifontibacillus erzurumensis]
MRLRNKPWAYDKIKEHPDLVIPEPQNYNGRWQQEIFKNGNPIHLEIGMGKGAFINGMAKLHPEINFIGIEKYTSVIVSALELTLENQLTNVRLLNIDAGNLSEIFAEGELSRIYLNFSDPWPKNRHEKRRLTYESFLAMYEKVLAKDGEIHFKTDNQGLFEYSLESFSKYGMLIKNISLDLHRSNIKENVMTEYEEKFSKQGNRIYRCEAQFR